MRVLVIDDNISISSMITKYLNKKNIDAMYTNNAKNGLELIKKNNFDGIILDLSMPEFSGYDFLKKLKSETGIEKIKIVVLTASMVNEAQENELKSLGVKSILNKPIDPNDLIDNLKNI